jgi:hypothetical protein
LRVIGAPPLAIGGLFVFRYRREKHVLQWGKAPAKIISESEIETRSGRVAKVSYSFEEDNGVTRENTKSLPVSDDPRQVSAMSEHAIWATLPPSSTPATANATFFFPAP